MTPVRTVAFEGHECIRLEAAGATLYVTISTGPRVLGLVVGDRNLFAVLPDAALEAPGGERYRLLGGHRLWAAPEVPEVTYRPDDRPCSVSEVEGGVAVESPRDGAGLVKSISVLADDGDRGWVVEHVLRNASDRTLRVAPWAITMLTPGGEAALPLGREPEGGLEADRAIVLWPYTDPADARIAFGPDEVRLDGSLRGPATKVGAAPGTGRVADRLGDLVFEKRVEVDPAAEYADRGAATQVYLCDDFCELETLGPLRDLAPGEAATHRERWTVRPPGDGGEDAG